MFESTIEQLKNPKNSSRLWFTSRFKRRIASVESRKIRNSLWRAVNRPKKSQWHLSKRCSNNRKPKILINIFDKCINLIFKGLIEFRVLRDHRFINKRNKNTMWRTSTIRMKHSLSSLTQLIKTNNLKLDSAFRFFKTNLITQQYVKAEWRQFFNSH